MATRAPATCNWRRDWLEGMPRLRELVLGTYMKTLGR